MSLNINPAINGPGPNVDIAASQVPKTPTSIMKVALPIFLILAALAVTVAVLIVTGPLALPFYVALIAFAVAGVSLLTLTGIGIYAYHTNRAAAESVKDPSPAPKPHIDSKIDSPIKADNSPVTIKDYTNAVRVFKNLIGKGSLAQVLKQINLIDRIQKRLVAKGYKNTHPFLKQWTAFNSAYKTFSIPAEALEKAFHEGNNDAIAVHTASILKIAREFPVKLLTSIPKRHMDRLILEASILPKAYQALSSCYDELNPILKEDDQEKIATGTSAMLQQAKEFPKRLLPEAQAAEMKEQMAHLAKLYYPALYNTLIKYAEAFKTLEGQDDFVGIINNLVSDIRNDSGILKHKKIFNDGKNILEIIQSLHNKLQEACKSLIKLENLPEELFKSDSSEVVVDAETSSENGSDNSDDKLEKANESEAKSDMATPAVPQPSKISAAPSGAPPSHIGIVLHVNEQVVNGPAAK